MGTKGETLFVPHKQSSARHANSQSTNKYISEDNFNFKQQKLYSDTRNHRRNADKLSFMQQLFKTAQFVQHYIYIYIGYALFLLRWPEARSLQSLPFKYPYKCTNNDGVLK